MLNIKPLAEYCNICQIPYSVDTPLSIYSTFAIGGNAPIFIEPRTEAHLIGTVQMLKKLALPFYILGRGSNVLFSDQSFPGVIIHLGEGLSSVSQTDELHLSAQMGTMLTDFAAFSARKGLSGLEFAYGIPGTVGGAVYMNAGAYGGEMSQVVSSCRYLDEDGQVYTLSPDALDFSYRHSFFTENRGIILSLEVKLSPGDATSIHDKMEENMEARRSKQPSHLPSAGSVFKRPKNGYASALIDSCGLKGKTVGGAQVSEKHAGFIVNIGGASCEDVEALIAMIQDTVYKKTGTALECELKKAEPVLWKETE